MRKGHLLPVQICGNNAFKQNDETDYTTRKCKNIRDDNRYQIDLCCALSRAEVRVEGEANVYEKCNENYPLLHADIVIAESVTVWHS